MASTTPPFNMSTFYTFANTKLASNTMSTNKATNGVINMTETGSKTGENWQIFPQEGRYFIRSRDFAGSYQLGLQQADQTVPQMYPKSGTLGQQWFITAADGGWKLVNGLLGNATYLALPKSIPVSPDMESGDTLDTWTITENDSAVARFNFDSGMFQEVADLEALQPLSPSSSLSTAASNASSTPTSTSSVSSSSSSSSSNPIGAGAIAGIAIGGVVVLLLLALGFWFWSHNRKSKKQASYYMHSSPNGPTENYTYHTELDSTTRPTEKFAQHAAWELESPRPEFHDNPTPRPTEKYAHRAELASPRPEPASPAVDEMVELP